MSANYSIVTPQNLAPNQPAVFFIVPVISLCGCDSVALVNASTQDITINNASIVFDYAGVNRLR